METSEKLQKIQVSCQISRLPVQVYPVLHSLSLEKGQKIPLIKKMSEEICLSTFVKSWNLKNLTFSFLSKSKEFFRVANGKVKSLVPCSRHFQTWGMTVNGKCLTAKISEYHKIEKDVSLSDILEPEPDQKYFLSKEVTEKILGESGKICRTA